MKKKLHKLLLACFILSTTALSAQIQFGAGHSNPGDFEYVESISASSNGVNYQMPFYYTAGAGGMAVQVVIYDQNGNQYGTTVGTLPASSDPTTPHYLTLGSSVDAGWYVWVGVFTPGQVGSVTPQSIVLSDKPGYSLLDVTQWGSIHWLSAVNMFYGCKSFVTASATDIPDFSGVQDFSQMFNEDPIFTGVPNMNSWNTSSAVSMYSMFYNDNVFNQNIGNWNVSKVTDFSYMFFNNFKFNQNISSWNTSSATSMSLMFYQDGVFNQNISSWDVSNVTDMSSMFLSAYAFNQNLGAWNLKSLSSGYQMFTSSGMDCTNYSLTLVGWDANPNTAANVSFSNQFGMGYGPIAGIFRQDLITSKGWTIGGDLQNCTALPISMASFTATPQGSSVQLNWATASEINNNTFAVQRSADGKNFATIASVASKAPGGNSSSNLSYNFNDANPTPGVNYYRLLQIDNNGNQSLSSTVTVNMANTATFKLYPNPTANIVYISGVQAGDNILVYTYTGAQIISKVAASSQAYFSLSNYSAGMYVVKVMRGNDVVGHDVVIKH